MSENSKKLVHSVRVMVTSTFAESVCMCVRERE